MNSSLPSRTTSTPDFFFNPLVSASSVAEPRRPYVPVAASPGVSDTDLERKEALDGKREGISLDVLEVGRRVMSNSISEYYMGGSVVGLPKEGPDLRDRLQCEWMER